MIGRVDLHTHTTASDGRLEPRQLVELAHRIGLRAIAITDHDTVAGLEEGIAAGHEFGVEVIPGIELSTEDNGNDIHMLGYFIDHRNKDFIEILRYFQSIRLERARKIISKLKDLGVEITIDEVIEIAGNSASIGRPHIAQAILNRGYVSDIQEAFDKYIGADSPAYVPKYKLPTVEGTSFLYKAGGIPVIAHPGLSTTPDYVEFLARNGHIRGIEVWHPEHTPEQVMEYYRLAEKYGLIKTGGSDFHGIPGKSKLGQVSVAYVSVAALKKLKIEMKSKNIEANIKFSLRQLVGLAAS